MRVLPSSWFSLTPDAFRRWGVLVLGGGLTLGVLLVLYLAWAAPSMLLLVPVLLVGGTAAWYVFRYPLVNLCVVLAGFVVVANYEEGFQFREIIYGLYLLAYLGYWFGTRLFVYREQILHTASEKALFLFLLLLPCTVVLTKLFGGSLGAAASEIFALSLLSLYFPIKEACSRYRHGSQALMFVAMGIGLFVAVRNMLNYQEVLLSATYTWQIEKGRVVTNDNLLMVTSLLGLVVLVFASNRRNFVLGLSYFLAVFAGLILTQSRGYWLAFLLGAGMMFLLVNNQYRGKMLILGFSGGLAVLGIGFLFFSDYMTLILGGLYERFTSVSTATTQDLSLVNRFLESKAVWSHIVENPILGHGTGVGYLFFDITRQSTDTDAFVHNGYLALWYKFGIWGLGLVLFFWGRTIWHGIQAFRQTRSFWVQACSLFAAIGLTAFILSTLTSNPFFLKDTTFSIGILAGLAGGCFHRTTLEARRPTS